MLRRAALLPTPRAALLIAACAPLALLIAAIAPGAWAATPALATVVLALVLIDAALAGRLAEVRLNAVSDCEVGDAAAITAEAEFAGGMPRAPTAAIAADPRLLAGGRGEWALSPDPDGTGWHGALAFTPTRRGAGSLEHLWLRWTGPLGLGARQTSRALDQAVRVWPNLGAVRSPALQTFLRELQFGLIARRFRGEGSQFEALSDYEPGMDRRRIDWKSSARHARLYAREYEAERNNQIVFAFDCGQAMCEPVGGLARIDRAVSAALTTAYVALKSGDRAALFGFAARVSLFTPFVSQTQGFAQLQRAAAELDYHAEEPNFTLALATLSARLARRSLIVVFSEFTDPASAEWMIESIARLTSRHLVLFVTLRDDELDTIAADTPANLQEMAMAVGADALLRQRALVLSRLRQIGVEVIEAPWQSVGTRLLDAYLAAKRRGAIG